MLGQSSFEKKTKNEINACLNTCSQLNTNTTKYETREQNQHDNANAHMEFEPARPRQCITVNRSPTISTPMGALQRLSARTPTSKHKPQHTDVDNHEINLVIAASATQTRIQTRTETCP